MLNDQKLEKKRVDGPLNLVFSCLDSNRLKNNLNFQSEFHEWLDATFATVVCQKPLLFRRENRGGGGWGGCYSEL